MGRFTRPLTPTEIASYDVLSSGLANSVRIISIPFIPGGYSGITIGNLIGLTKAVSDDGTSALLAHELVHVSQWYELGRSRFIGLYLGQFAVGLIRFRSWNQAYLAIDLEVQARSAAADWCRRCI